MSDVFKKSIENALEPVTKVIESIRTGETPVEALPTEATTANVPATIPEVDRYFRSVFDVLLSTVICSRSLSDVLYAFGLIKERLGRAKFVLAAVLYVIKKACAFKRWGFDSIEDFVDSLPAKLRFSRQTFYNLLWAGQILVEHFGFLEYGLKDEARVDLGFLYRNFAKLPILWKAIYRKHRPLDVELYERFLNDSKVTFERYVRGEVKPRATGKRSQAAAFAMPVLDPTKQRICETYARGYRVGFIVDQPDRRAIEIALKFKVLREGNAAYARSTANDRSMFDGSELSELVPKGLRESILKLAQAVETLDHESIRSILADQFRNMTELRLAQAYLIHRLKHDPDLKRQLPDFEVSCASDFAARYLDIDEAKFKWLSRLGRNLVHYAPLFGREFDLDFEGCLEKLSILHTAMENHVGQSPLVVEMLRTLSVAKFRRFARDRDYHPEQEVEPVSRRTLKLAKDELLRYDALIAAGHKVDVIELRTPKEVESFGKWVKRFELLPGAILEEPILLPSTEEPILLPAPAERVEPTMQPEYRAA